MVKVTEIIQRKQYGKKLKCIPLSVSTAGRCTGDTDKDLKKQVLKQVTQCGRFAIQLSESTEELLAPCGICISMMKCTKIFF